MKYFIATFSSIFAYVLLLGQASTNDDIFVTKPYLQIGRHPSPRSLDLLWHSIDKYANWEFEIEKTTGGGWQKMSTPAFVRITAAGIGIHRVYHVNITGLNVGGSFNYRVIKEGKIVFSSDAIAPKLADQWSYLHQKEGSNYIVEIKSITS